MRFASCAKLLSFLQEHGFLTPALSPQLHGDASRFSDVRALARELVMRNCLTAYQANQILQGRGDDLILGPYRVLDRLGEGGMGQVFKAHHATMDRTVALKIIPRDCVSNSVALGRFYREVRAVAKLSHPNIVTAFEVCQTGARHFLAMEYVEGIDLARLVQQSGPLPISQACDYVRQAALGLQHAYEKGLIHRDIKPGNLMVARPHPDLPPVIKILDFGLARFDHDGTHAERLTQLGSITGTVDYIAPEQAQDARTADIRADIYSLGCSLFYLLTGQPPFPGKDVVEKLGPRVLGNAPSVRKIRPEVRSALEEVITKMMARNPADRYQTPEEVAKALQLHPADEGQGRSTQAPVSQHDRAYAATRTRSGTSEAITAAPPGTFPQPVGPLIVTRGYRSRGSNPWPGLAIVGSGLALIVVVLVIMLRSSENEKAPTSSLAKGNATAQEKGIKPVAEPPGETRPDMDGNPAKTVLDSAPKRTGQRSEETTKANVAAQPNVPPTNLEPEPKPRDPNVSAKPESQTNSSKPNAPEPKAQYLSKMQEFGVKAAEGRFAKNGNLGYSAGGSDKIKVKGKESPNGLSMHAPSNDYARAQYKLGNTAQRFMASVALNDSAGDIPTPLVFQVLGDGKVLWQSKPIKNSGLVQACEVDIRGVGVLELRVNCPGIYINAQAVWLEPRLLIGPPPTGDVINPSREDSSGDQKPASAILAAGKTGAAVYDEYPEPLRSLLVMEWQAELEALRRAIRGDEERLRRAKTVKEREHFQLLITQYKGFLARHEKNNPAYFTKERQHDLKAIRAGDALSGKPVKLITNSIGMQLGYIPPGKFIMGSAMGEKERAEHEHEHEVEISQGFYMGIHEVTQGEYSRIMGTNPSHFARKGGGKSKIAELDPDQLPVESISWHNAMEFCRRLTLRETRVKWVYDLPTEAEWEYACRAGTKTPFFHGDSLSSLQANFKGDEPYATSAKEIYLQRTARVGSFQPNPFGLFDMHGNVFDLANESGGADNCTVVAVRCW